MYSTSIFAQWQPIPISDTNVNLSFLDFYDANNGVVGGLAGKYARTTDGGQNWENFDLANFKFTYTAFDVAYREGIIILAGFKSSPRKPQLLRSVDNGQSWTSVYLGDGTQFASVANFMRKVTFLTSTDLVAIGDGGIILRSTDAGEIWEDVFDDSEVSLGDLSFSDEKLGYTVGEDQFLTTTDGGENWTMQTIEGLTTISNVAAVKGTTWVYASDGYQVYLSKDAGINWSPTDTTSGFYRERMQAIGEEQPIVSNGGAIYTSETQGEYWERQQFAVDVILNNFQFVDSEIGYAVGNAGVVFKTEDRGGRGYPQAVINSNAAFETCPNEEIKFENLSDLSLDYQWIVNGVVAENLTELSVDLSFDSSGTQRVGIIVDNGFFQDTAYSAVNILAIRQPESVNFTANKNKICANEPVRVEVRDAPRGQTYQVFLGGVPIGSPLEGKGNTLNWTVRGILNDVTIELVVIKEQICQTTGVTYSQAIEVEPYNNPNVFGSTSKDNYCPSDSITLIIHNSIADFEYEVKIDSLYLRSKQTGKVELFQNYEVGKKNGNGQDLTFTYYLSDLLNFEYLRGNKHSVFVTNTLGCSTILPFQIESIVDTTSANFQIPSDFIYEDEPLTINTLTPASSTFQWDFGATATPSTSTAQNPRVTFSEVSYDQNIQLITESENGCLDTLIQPIYVHQKAIKTQGMHCDINDRFVQNHLLVNEDRYTILDATTDVFGNTLICGAFTDERFSNIPRIKLFVIKFDKTGRILWEKTDEPTISSGVAGSMCGAVATDAEGNIYLGGSFTGSNLFFQIDDFKFPQAQDFNNSADAKKCFVLKLDPAGNIIWAINSYQINGAQIISDITDIIVTESNQIFISCMGGSAIFNFTDGVTTELWTGLNILEINADGQLLQKTAAGDFKLNRSSYLNLESSTLSTNKLAVVSPKMALTHTNKLVLVGTMEDTVDFGNGLSITPKYEEGTSGYVAILDAASLTWDDAFTTYDMNFLVHRRDLQSVLPPMAVNQAGAILFAQSWREFPLETGKIVEIGSHTYRQGSGNILAKYDLQGNNLWANYSLTPAVRSLAIQEDESVLTYGQFTGFLSLGDVTSQVYGTPSNGKDDLFLAAFDTNGQHQWATVLGSVEDDKAGILVGGCHGISHFSAFGVNPIVDENNYTKDAVQSIFPFAPNADCVSTTCATTVSTSTANFSKPFEVIISPNPAHDYTNLQVTSQNLFEEVDCYLYNRSGQLIKKYSFQTNENLKIATHQFSNGIYFYKVQNSSTGAIIGGGKFVKH